VIRRILVLGALLVVAMAGTAHAQYVPGEPGIIVDPSSVTVGGTIEVQGSGCPRDVDVNIYVGDVVVATTHTGPADGTGSFDVKGIVLPSSIGPGEYLVHARCGDLDLTAVLTVTAVPVTIASPTANLPTTGSDSGWLIRAGFALVAVGGFAVLISRRRRATI
jgi:LPXTG-motif cell wall-anchored protein